MSEMATQLERPSQDPATRAKAVAYLTETGNADILAILGLEPEPPRGNCPVCGNLLARHGGCNRRKACREATQLLQQE